MLWALGTELLIFFVFGNTILTFCALEPFRNRILSLFGFLEANLGVWEPDSKFFVAKFVLLGLGSQILSFACVLKPNLAFVTFGSFLYLFCVFCNQIL